MSNEVKKNTRILVSDFLYFLLSFSKGLLSSILLRSIHLSFLDFLGQILSKNYQLKLKFSTYTIRNIWNSMVMFPFLQVLSKKYIWHLDVTWLISQQLTPRYLIIYFGQCSFSTPPSKLFWDFQKTKVFWCVQGYRKGILVWNGLSISKAAVRICSSEKVFLNISEISLENTVKFTNF